MGYPAKNQIGALSSTADETIQRYIETVGKVSWLESLPAKILRFATTTGIGALDPISGTLLTAADTFLLGRWRSESREEVESLIARAVAAGGRTPHPPEDHGFMYDQGFEDLDGHLWNLVWMAPQA